MQKTWEKNLENEKQSWGTPSSFQNSDKATVQDSVVLAKEQTYRLMEQK